MTAPVTNYNRISAQIDAIILANKGFKDAGQKIKNYVIEGDVAGRVGVQSKRLLEAQEATYAYIKKCVSWKLEWQLRALDHEQKSDADAWAVYPRKKAFKDQITGVLNDIAEQADSRDPITEIFVIKKIEELKWEANRILSEKVGYCYRFCHFCC